MSNFTFDDLRTRENRENNDKKFFKFREFFDEFRQKTYKMHLNLVHIFASTKHFLVDRCGFKQYMP